MKWMVLIWILGGWRMVGGFFLLYVISQAEGCFSYLFEKQITVFSRLSSFIITNAIII